MTVAEFLDEAAAWSKKATTVRPKEMDALLSRQLDIDKNLATCVLAFGASYDLKDVAWEWFLRARRQEGDRATLASFAAEHFENEAASFQDCYALGETSGFLRKAAQAVREAAGWDELAGIFYAVDHHMIRTYYWIDATFPWAELSPIHARLRREADAATG